MAHVSFGGIYIFVLVLGFWFGWFRGEFFQLEFLRALDEFFGPWDVGILLLSRELLPSIPHGNHRIIWSHMYVFFRSSKISDFPKIIKANKKIEQMLPDQTPLSSVLYPWVVPSFPVRAVGIFHTSRSVWISICGSSYYEGQSRPINLTFLVFKKQGERYPFQKFGKWKHRIFSQKGHFLEDHSRTCK